MNREPCLRRPQWVLPDVGPPKKKKKIGGKICFILFLYPIFTDWVKYFYSVCDTMVCKKYKYLHYVKSLNLTHTDELKATTEREYHSLFLSYV